MGPRSIQARGGCPDSERADLPGSAACLTVTSVVDEARGRLLGRGPHATAQSRRETMDKGTRDELLSRLAEAVGSVTVAHPTRVAIDGPPAAGKTTLADELAVVLRDTGPRRHPRDDRRFPLPPGTALSARRVLGRRLLLRHLRLRRAEPGSARSARPGRRPTLPTRGLRPRHGHRAVPAGHDCPRRRCAGSSTASSSCARN